MEKVYNIEPWRNSTNFLLIIQLIIVNWAHMKVNLLTSTNIPRETRNTKLQLFYTIDFWKQNVIIFLDL